jgi:hypothetical protein
VTDEPVSVVISTICDCSDISAPSFFNPGSTNMAINDKCEALN